MAVLDGHLAHAEAIPRALGLAVRKRMEGETESVDGLLRELAHGAGRTAEEELAILRAYSGETDGDDRGIEAPSPGFPAGNGSAQSGRPARKARTTFQVQSALGEAKCTASQGRLELRLDTDFTAFDRRRLEAVVEEFLGRLME
jgi:ParB family chromosome partitioning protein